MKKSGHSDKGRYDLATLPGYTFKLNLKIYYIPQQVFAKHILNKGGCYIMTISHLGQNKIVKILGP